jgi:drug/metabolite transporter (DMT)-like permease
MDSASFTLIRLLSGAVVLAILGYFLRGRWVWGSGSWISGALLFTYAIAFSFAYTSLPAGTGGLILFASVQFTMIGVGIWKGERPSSIEWVGLIIAQAGLIVLVAPGLLAPPPLAALLMAIAGLAWGLYSLRGKSAKDPALATGDNFVRAVPFAIVVAAIAFPRIHIAPSGVALAVLSGAMTSGLGYLLWYSVLPHLTAARAAISQLAVPALVAIMGVLALSEKTTPRFVIASAMMLGGVAIAVLRRVRPTKL